MLHSYLVQITDCLELLNKVRFEEIPLSQPLISHHAHIAQSLCL